MFPKICSVLQWPQLWSRLSNQTQFNLDLYSMVLNICTKFLNPFSRFHDRRGTDRRKWQKNILPFGIFQVRKYLKRHKQDNMCKKREMAFFYFRGPYPIMNSYYNPEVKLALTQGHSLWY